MKYLIWIAAVAGLMACNRHNEDFDPNNHATARRNGVAWGAGVSIIPYYYDSSLISINVGHALGETDPKSVDDFNAEILYFEKFPLIPGTYFLNRRELTITDSFSSHQRIYRNHVGEGPYAVRYDGDENNWLRIDSYDPNTGRLEATFQGTYVKCYSDFEIYGGDSIIFTDGKLVGVLKP